MLCWQALAMRQARTRKANVQAGSVYDLAHEGSRGVVECDAFCRRDHGLRALWRCGRAKDFARVLALLESGSVSREEIARLAERHDLSAAWERFEARFLNE
jgi:hypothetical protein